MKIRIKAAGLYMDRRSNAISLQRGDILDTKDWYAQSLIADHYAEPVNAPAPDPDPENAAASSAPAPEAIHQVVGVDEVFDPTPPPAAHEAEPEEFEMARLPGMTSAILKELTERGVTDKETLVAGLTTGTLVNIPV